MHPSQRTKTVAISKETKTRPASDGAEFLRPSEQLTDDQLVDLYRDIHLIRRFSERQVEEFESGRMPGGLHPGHGHEAISAAVPRAVRPSDYLNGTHRSQNGILALRGVSFRRLWAEVFGRETGINGGRRGVDLMGTFEDDIRVWAHNPVLGHNAGIATGAALALQLDERDEVIVCLIGDGASVCGTVWEACFFAGIRKLPIVYAVENNMVAYTTRFEDMSPIENISDRASAFGFPGQLVDGNDALAVLDAVHTAAERARRGEGPTLLELKTYRFVGHFIGDPQVYRTREEVSEARKSDPLHLFEALLRDRGLLDDAAVTNIHHENLERIDAGLAEAMLDPFPNPADALSRTYRSGTYPMGYSS